MTERQNATLHPDDPPLVPATTSERSLPSRDPSAWTGPTYYGRSQLKAAPFENSVVGGYIFLAGMSGSAMLLGTIADWAGGARAEEVGARGRWLSLLAPTIGSGLLVYDLRTPHRFYNMLRVAKRTSPMSIGTWILAGFSTFALPAAGAEALGLRAVAKWVQVPAAAAGAGLSVYTAALLSATSTPTWAAAPRALAVRYGSSSIVSGAAALALGREPGRGRSMLEAVMVTALAVETAADLVENRMLAAKGIKSAKRSAWGRIEDVAVLGVGTLLPIALLAWSRRSRDARASRRAADAACVAALAGSAMLRVSVMGVGDVSAKTPELSFRFASPENLPKAVEDNRIGITEQQALPYRPG